jgi:predicted outer membrane repeat protein
MTKRSYLLALLLLLAMPAALLAATWRVEPDGSGDLATIQAAVDTLAPGDTLILGSGVYTGDGNINVGIPARAFILTSETGDPEDCVIDCEGHLGPGRTGFQFPAGSSGPVIRGITVRNGHGSGTGGAADIQGSPKFRDCIFESNYGDYMGGAMSIYNGTGFPEFKNCSFVSNQAALDGGAIYIDGVVLVVTVDSCSFYDNLAGRYGGAICCYMHEAEAHIHNSVFVGNLVYDSGGAIAAIDMVTDIRNCTIFANSAPTGSGIADFGGPLGYGCSDVQGCIIAYGTGGSGYFQATFAEDARPLYCTNLYGNEGGDWVDSIAVRLGVDGNVSEDPAFCNIDFEPYDLSLCDYSPCLPGNHPDGYDCGLIGALGEGCVCDPTSTKPSTWGAIKALYR